MNRLLMILALAIGFSLNMTAQKDVRVRVVDYITNIDVVDSLLKVELLAPDSTFISEGYAFQNGTGKDDKLITEAGVEVEHEGQYLMRLSHPDYYTLYAPIKVKFYRRENIIHIGKLGLKRKPKDPTTHLGEALVTATKLKFYFDNDTLVYNADAFITQKGFVLQNILQKMPGLTINNDGEILSNGRKVETLLLNGKDFFNNDRKTLLENLPALMVKHVKVYEKEKDTTSLFERERELKGLVMDIKLKPEYRSTFLTKLDAAAGTDHRYYGRVLALKVHDLHRWSVYAGANNTNHNEELTRNGQFYNADNGVGQKKFYNAGILYNVDEREGKYAIEGSARVQWSKEDLSVKSLVQQFFDQRDIYMMGATSDKSRNFSLQTNHNFSLFTTSPWSVSIKPTFSHVHTRNQSENLAASFDKNVANLLGTAWTDSLRNFSLGETLKRYGIMRANTFQVSPSDVTNAKLEVEKIIKISHTPDRLTLNASGGYTHSGLESFTLRRIDYLQTSAQQAQHQYQNDWANQWQWEGCANYLYQLSNWHKFNAKLSYERVNVEASSRFYQLHLLPSWMEQMKANAEQLPDPSQLALSEDPQNSKAYQETLNNYAAELNYEFLHGKYMLTASVPLRYQQRELAFFQKANDQNIHRSMLRPDINIMFIAWKGGQIGANYRFDYTLKHEMPTMLLLAHQTNNVNPLLVFQGNPDLRNSAVHTLKGRYYLAPTMRHNHTLSASYNYYVGRVSTAMLYDAHTGVTTATFKNVDGNQQFQAELENAVFLSPKFTHKLTSKFTFNYNKSVDFSGLTIQEAERTSTVHNYHFIEELKYAFALPNTKVRGEFSPYISYHRSASSRDNFEALHATVFGSQLSLYVELPWSMRLQTDLRTISRRGYNEASMNDNEFIWNANLTKAFTNKFSVNLEAFDLLGQRKNVIRFVNAQSRTESIYNNLRRYVMLHLTWTLF